MINARCASSEGKSPVKIAAFILYALFVSLVSLAPGSGVPIEGWDKLLHFLTYGLFAVFGFGIVGTRKGYLFVCLGIVAFSGLIEVGQSFVPGRFMSAYDLLANALGVVTGASFVSVLVRLRGEAGTEA